MAANTVASANSTELPETPVPPNDETHDFPDLSSASDPTTSALEPGVAGCDDAIPDAEQSGPEGPEEKGGHDEKDENDEKGEKVEHDEEVEKDEKEIESAVAPPDPPIPAVQICVRLRPMLPWERAEGYEPSAMELKEGMDGTIALKDEGRHRQFRFNAVISGDRSQQEVWDMSRIDAVVRKVAQGFHATVFAYGQTGTGKTHTMEGFTYEHHCGGAPTIAAARPRVKAKSTPADQLGIVPRAVLALFDRVEAMKSDSTNPGQGPGMATTSSCVVRLSFLQIYNEKIFDLLNPSITVSQREVGGRGEEFSGLRLRWDAAKRHFFVENLFQYECSSAEEALQYYQQGIQNKQVASTTMNVASSRSHTLLVLTLLRREGLNEEENNTPKAPAPQRPCKEVISHLSLVDLAGSERSITGREAQGKSSTRFQEAINVNQSLFVLRRVITALSKREGNPREVVHVPYRESKLTSLLQNSLGGNSYLVMFACLAPSDRQDDENLSTLQYASQAACIRNQPVVNLDPKDQLIQQLEARLTVAHDYLRRVLQLSELPEDLLEEERKAAAPGRRRPAARIRAAKSQAAKVERTGDVPTARPLVRARTWTGEQRWEFQEDGNGKDNGKDGDVGNPKSEKAKVEPSESSRESSKSRARPKKVSGQYGSSATSTLSRIVQGAAQKSPSCDDWPFATRSRKSETAEGQELFAAVDAMMRGYGGPKPSPRKLKSRPASLPPVVPEVSPSQWPPKPPKAAALGRESPAASVRSADTALESVAGSKCSCCGSDRTPQTEAETEKNNEVLEVRESLQKAQHVQRRLEDELLAAHQKIQDLEVQQSKFSEAEPSLQSLQSENAELQRRLEVFYKAMEFDVEEPDASPSSTNQEELTPTGALAAMVPDGSAAASIGQKIEKFHSQLVLEAVTLRNEVARLKKKKWIIKAVLDNGGEHERQAIAEEVAKLRSQREADDLSST